MVALAWLRRRRCADALAALLVMSAGAHAVYAQQARPEYEIKAAYLFTFGRFVEWPARAGRDGDFAICVLGADPFGAVLDTTLASSTLRGRKVIARRLSAPQDATACHILFISASEERELATIVATLARSDVLTVSDMPRFVGRGGMIQFQTSGGRVRFEIDLPPALDAGLLMSSDLLRVASAVRRDRQRGE